MRIVFSCRCLTLNVPLMGLRSTYCPPVERGSDKAWTVSNKSVVRQRNHDQRVTS